MQPAPPASAPRRPSKRFQKKWYGIALGVLIVGSLASVQYARWSSRSVIEPSLIRSATIPVYAPSDPPAGYHIVSIRTRLAPGVLTYVFEHEGDHNEITVSVQPKPTGFDMTELAKGGQINGTAIKNGTLYNLSTAQNSRYVLDSGDALVYFTSSQDVSAALIRVLAENLDKRN